MKNIIILLSFLLLLIHPYALPAEPEEERGLMSASFRGSPTFISSDSLVLQTQKRLLEYQGNVEVIHEDLNLKCEVLQVIYDESNQIEELIALRNVFITKGEEIRARGERAVYEQADESLTLTENPELQQDGSVLTADRIRIFLAEDRSVAEGEVRVKLIGQAEKGRQQKVKP